MPTPITFLHLQVLLKGIQQTGIYIAEDFAQLIRDVLDAFPNPFRMISAVLFWGNGLAGRIVALPFVGLEAIVQDYLKVAGLSNKVITGKQAVRWFFESFTAFSQTITLTRDFGILYWLAETAAVWLYRTFKHWQFIWRATRIRNEADLVKLFVDKFARRIGTLRIVGLILGMFLVLAFAGAQLALIGVGITLLDGSAADLFLPQDSKRRRIFIRDKVRRRFNKRPGKDQKQ